MTNNSGSRGFLSVRLLGCLIVAVVVSGLAFPAAWLFLGGGIWRGEVNVVGAELRSPPGLKLSRALVQDRLVLIVDSCNGDPKVSLLRETDADVQVKVVASSTPLRGGKDCLDVVEVQLQEPLGGRVVVDKHTGQPVTVITVYFP